MTTLTAVILTLNEEKNLPDCLASLKDFAQRVVVVDSGSTDAPREIALSMGAEFLEHPFENNARQFNWALDNADIRTDWVLRIDADERMTPAVIRECRSIMDGGDAEICGIIMQATFYMMGKPLNHGMRKKRKLMIFRRGAARIENRYMDEHTVLSRGRSVSIRARFDHMDFKSIDHFVQKLNWYASREVLDVLGDNFSGGDQHALQDASIARTRKLKSGLYYRFPMFLRAWLLFLYCYIFRLGFLDGKEGLIYNFLYAYMYRFVVDAKLYEARKTGHYNRAPGALK